MSLTLQSSRSLTTKAYIEHNLKLHIISVCFETKACYGIANIPKGGWIKITQ